MVLIIFDVGMLTAYLKLKLRIGYRALAEIGLLRILFLLPFVVLLCVFVFIQTHKFKFSWIILTLTCVYLILQYRYSRKDADLLKIFSKGYWQFFFVDSILISILFIALDFRIAPILFLFAYLIARFSIKNQSTSKKLKLTRSIFIKGSIEWESTFRQYNLYTLIIWLLAFVFAVVGHEKYFAFVALGGLGVDAGTLFLKPEPLWYLQQYRNKGALLKHSLSRILFNVALPLLFFDVLIIAVFPDQIGILISIYFVVIFYLVGTFVVRLAVSDQQLLLYIIQGVFLSLVVAALLNVSFLIFLFLFMAYVLITAYKNLKMIYD